MRNKSSFFFLVHQGGLQRCNLLLLPLLLIVIVWQHAACSTTIRSKWRYVAMSPTYALFSNGFAHSFAWTFCLSVDKQSGGVLLTIACFSWKKWWADSCASTVIGYSFIQCKAAIFWHVRDRRQEGWWARSMNLPEARMIPAAQCLEKGKCDHQLKRISPNITASKLKTAVRTVDFLQSQSQCVRTLSVKGNILSGQHFLRICFWRREDDAYGEREQRERVKKT